MRRLSGSALLPRYCTRVGWRQCIGSIGNVRGIACKVIESSSGIDIIGTRAAEIRRRELLFRWLRRLVVPAFSIYGLFLLRPTEGHFLRYAAERRHLDTAFNAWFPPVALGIPKESASTVAPATTTAPTAASASSPTNGEVVGRETLSPPNAIAAAFRSERDREWAAQRFNYKKGSEDEERVARKRLLFARDRVYFSDDTVVETIRSQSDQLEELSALREHPPMHLLSEQLNTIAEESRRYASALAAAGNRKLADDDGAALPTSVRSDAAAISSPSAVAPRPRAGAASAVVVPPTVEVQFEDHFLFATAAIIFRDCDHRVVRTMRFIGACGMMWKELA
ncbi:hypothetical protein JKF63_06762 [Porcisia hertigi]|uniref:Uncharacterized protein n=1 Tax=Porcisia hertigi TaxID=2761500 RepID=A0A836LG68_9TRYP|nr:hypothetical protein JKF63_06762 [Porcisia hertigi]